MTTRTAVLIALGALAAPQAAGAQAPPPPAAAPPPAPLFTLTPEKVGKSRTVLAGTQWRVRGVVQPYVAGQHATVRFTRNGRKVKVKRVALLPSSTGRSGYFLVKFESAKAGRVAVRAETVATPQQPQLVAEPRGVVQLGTRAVPGQRGATVRELQRRLASLGYVVGRRGVYDGRTARAVMAFRKMVGIRRGFDADREVFRRLVAGQGAYRVRRPQLGRHVEADLSRQVLVLIGAGGRVERIYHTSTGAPATPTILGTYRVYSKTPGTNAKGMVHSSYFIRGYAIHGFASVPPYPASHGCLRVPVPDAMSIFRWVRHGTPVHVYA